MVATNDYNYRQTTYNCYPIVPGGKSARDNKNNNNKNNNNNNDNNKRFYLKKDSGKVWDSPPQCSDKQNNTRWAIPDPLSTANRCKG